MKGKCEMGQRITSLLYILHALVIVTSTTVAFAQEAQALADPTAVRLQADHRMPGQSVLTPVEQRALQEAFPRYLRTLESALRASRSPRDRALSTQLMQFDEPQHAPMQDDAARGDLLRNAAQAAPRDHLVQWIWANASDGASGCTRANPCPGRGLALAVLEPDNGAAWIPAIARAYITHDIAGYDESIEHMVAAKGYDDKSHDLMAAWGEVVRKYSVIKLPSSIHGIEQPKPGDSDPGFLGLLVSMQHSAVTSSTNVMALSCDPAVAGPTDPRRETACAKVARLLLNHGDSMQTRLVGLQILDSSKLATEEDHVQMRTFTWQMDQYTQLLRTAKGDSRAAMDFDGVIQQLRRAHIALTPPVTWNPEGNQGHPEAPG